MYINKEEIPMYEIDIYDGNEWVTIGNHNDLNGVNRELFILMNNLPRIAIRILENNCVMCFLDNSEEQYNWFKEKYIDKTNENNRVLKLKR